MMRARSPRRVLYCALGLSLLGACADDTPARAPDAGDNPTDAAQPADAGGFHGECPLTPPSVCPDPKPSFADVQPVFQQRCFSCHDGTQEQWPLTTYQHVADWFGEIRAQLIACTMPPAAAKSEMSLEERMQILKWIRCGYPQ